MNKNSTEACKALLAKTVPGTKAKDWKRLSKSKQGAQTVRTFSHKDGTPATVVYDSTTDTLGAVLGAAIALTQGPKFPKRDNQIIFAVGYDDTILGPAIRFFCGEEDQGALSDQETFESEVYEAIFPDRPCGSYGTSENCHVIPLNEGERPSELKTLIRQRLIAAGAVERPEMGEDDGLENDEPYHPEPPDDPTPPDAPLPPEELTPPDERLQLRGSRLMPD